MDKVPDLINKSQNKDKIHLRILNYDDEIKNINDDAVETSHRLLLLCDEAKERGMETLAALEDQDEQLDNIENTMYKISSDMVRVRRDIKKANECLCYPLCGSISWLWKKIVEQCTCTVKEQENISHISSSEQGIRHSYYSKTTTNKTLLRASNDNTIEQEIERNTVQLETALDSMKCMALDIDVQLRIQEPKVNRIHMMVENNDISMNEAHQRIKKIP